MSKIRGFELVSKYEDEKEKFKVPARGTKKSACYDIFNNTDFDIVLQPGEMSSAITTYFKAYMLDDEVLMAYVRSGHGFKFSVRLANSTGIIDCVPKGTLLSTPSGDIPVEKFMYEKYPIYSFNEETHNIEEDDIQDIWIVNDLELLEISTEDGKTVSIPINKEIFTKRGWIKACELSTNDEILTLD